MLKRICSGLGLVAFGCVLLGCPSKNAPVRKARVDNDPELRASRGFTEGGKLQHKQATKSPQMPVSKACMGLPKSYGYVKTNPIEPGRRGMRMGRSVIWRCPSGVVAKMRRLGNVGRSIYPTRSPKVGMGFDVVDLWMVRCPKVGVRRVYVNAYRKGHGCAPPPFAEVPRKALYFRSLAFRFMKRGDTKRALLSINRALRLAGGLDILYLAKGIILFRGKYFAEAIPVFKKMISMRPGAQVSGRLLLGITYAKMGKLQQYGKILDGLLQQVPPRHRTYPLLLCRKAYYLRQTKRKGSVRFAQKACALGQKRCCWRPGAS